MKIKDGVVIRQIEDEYILVDTGKIAPKFYGMIKLNETSKDIVTFLINEDLSIDNLVTKMLEMYDIDRSSIEKEIFFIVDELKKNNIIL